MPMLKFSCLSCAREIYSETGTSLCRCTSCGVQQAVPMGMNPEMLSVYADACNALRSGVFYEAFRMSEKITTAFPDNPCAHWLGVLAQYGVEYVRMADASRPRAESGLLNVVPVKSSLHYVGTMSSADADMAAFAEEYAELIDGQQNALRAAALKARVYDVFIACLPAGGDLISQNDRNAAMHLYQRLAKNGLHVYMRGVNGETDEASVFSALHSAKLMFVYGSNAEILCDSELQQDWMRYIQISCETDRGALIVMHDRNFNDSPAELVPFKHFSYRNNGPVSACVRLAVKSARDFPNAEDADARAQAWAADAVAQQFDVAMQLREKQEHKAALFADLCAKQRVLHAREDYEALGLEFRKLGEYRDAADRALFCARKAEQFRFEKMRNEETARLSAENRKRSAQTRQAERKNGLPKKKKRDRLEMAGGIVLFSALTAAVVLLFTQLLLPYGDYRRANDLLLSGQAEEAYSIFEQLDGFLDSEEQCRRIQNAMQVPVPSEPFANSGIR